SEERVCWQLGLARPPRAARREGTWPKSAPVRGGTMKLQAEKRAKGKVGDLRRQGRLPVIVYNNELNQPLSVNARAFDKALRVVGSSSLLDLEFDGEVHSVLVKQVQMDKRRREAIHVDFYAVTA